ncbi:MAG: hypothetical protein NUV55_11160 [Sulfuricaulis sp.]|uniref:hypothetical protein n=1 Tax=Sulfuricaulis sp. TaxID=2003553 RepID=UPI0025D8B1ED|nr:hypothetical protein [Sulfuricaulis sp.]MCR4347743.1 hypothetical protein [Sulfuricaulis sp.]
MICALFRLLAHMSLGIVVFVRLSMSTRRMIFTAPRWSLLKTGEVCLIAASAASVARTVIHRCMLAGACTVNGRNVPSEVQA